MKDNYSIHEYANEKNSELWNLKFYHLLLRYVKHLSILSNMHFLNIVEFLLSNFYNQNNK